MNGMSTSTTTMTPTAAPHRSGGASVDGPAVVHERTAFAQFYERSREEPIYVILGVQGSGTNLLGRLLTKLFKFSVMRDRSMVFKAAARLGPHPTRADVDREIRLFENIVSPSAVRRKTSKYVIRKSKPLQGLIPELCRADIRSGADFARLIYTYRAFSLGAAHIGIKSDDLWQHLHLIDEVIPNRRVLLLTRDFRDNLLSVSGKHFGPIEPIRAARYVKRQVGLYAAEFHRAGASGYHLKYETLLNSPRLFVDDFSRCFGVRPAVDPDIAVPALRFRPNKIGKWKQLPEQELAWCEGILHDELLEFGYPLASASPEVPGLWPEATATVRDTVKRVPQRVRRIMNRLKS
jgi:hypothetical protein